MRNILILNGIDFHSQFFQAIMRNQNNQREELENLRNEVINHYSSLYQEFELKQFDGNILNFVNFKNEGIYNDLTFNRVSDESGSRCSFF